MKMTKYLIFMTILIGILYLTYVLWFELGRAPTAEQRVAKANPSQLADGLFKNEVDTPIQTGKISYIQLLREAISPANKKVIPSQALPSARNQLSDLPQQTSSIVWFGHSSYLLTLDGFTILVDPVFSGHSSPLPFLINSFKGTDVYSVDDLPPIDVLLISHDHYDHLDYETVTKLQRKVKRVVVPLGVGEHFRFWGYDSKIISELNWYESTTVKGVTDSYTFTATPARHFSGRGLVRNQTLWASFVIHTKQHNVYVGGDSGYGSHFKEIGERYGPFDLAMLESGQYSDNWRFIHMMPEETVQAALDLKTKLLFPVHWGKFQLSSHDWDEPIKRVTIAAQAQNQAVMAPVIGQISRLWQVHNQNPWWEQVSVWKKHNDEILDTLAQKN